MPIYMELSRLHRCVTLVARGRIAPDEIAGAFRQLAEAKVPHFAKLVDVASATSEVSAEQVAGIAQALAARAPESGRGPIAFLVDRNTDGFPRLFAETQDKRRVHLFTSLREARAWLLETQRVGWQDEPTAGRSSDEQAASRPWSDPQREATMFRGTQRRSVRVDRSRPSYALG